MCSPSRSSYRCCWKVRVPGICRLSPKAPRKSGPGMPRKDRPYAVQFCMLSRGVCGVSLGPGQTKVRLVSPWSCSCLSNRQERCQGCTVPLWKTLMAKLRAYTARLRQHANQCHFRSPVGWRSATRVFAGGVQSADSGASRGRLIQGAGLDRTCHRGRL